MNAILKSMAAMSVAFTVASSAFAADTINFGIISTESQQNLKTSWEPLLADLSKKTGLDVKPFFAQVSLKACASTRCRWLGTAISRLWKL